MSLPTIIPLVELAAQHLCEIPEDRRADVLDSIATVLTAFGEAPELSQRASWAARALRDARANQMEFQLLLSQSLPG